MFLLKNFSTVMASYSTNMVVNAIINLKASFLTKNLPDLKRRFVVKRYVFAAKNLVSVDLLT